MLNTNFNYKDNLNEFLLFPKIGIFSIIFGILTSLLLIIIGIYFNILTYLLPISIGLVLIPFLIKYPLFWIYTFTFFGLLFIERGEEGISAKEVIAALFIFPSILIWIFYKLLVKKEIIIRYKVDWFLIVSLLIFPFGIVIALLQGVDLLNSFRIYLTLIVILFMFPIRKIIKTKNEVIVLLIIFGIVTFLLDFKQFYDFRTNFAKVALINPKNVLIRISANQTLFTNISLISLIFALINKKLIFKILLYLLSITTAIALVTTYSRAFWLFYIFMIILFVLIFKLKYKIEIIIFILLFSLSSFAVIYTFYRDKATIAINFLDKRISSSSNVSKDESLNSRFVQNREILKKIYELPLGGNGFGKPFTYQDPLSKSTFRTIFVDNGYLTLIYRVGYPLVLIFLTVFVYFLFKSIYLYINTKDEFFKMLSLSIAICISEILVTNLISGQIESRDSLYIEALCFGLIYIVDRNYMEEKNGN